MASYGYNIEMDLTDAGCNFVHWVQVDHDTAQARMK
jgi:hypothetical protein